jgi:hypothetical protein
VLGISEDEPDGLQPDKTGRALTVSFGFDETQQRHHSYNKFKEAAEVDDADQQPQEPSAPSSRCCDKKQQHMQVWDAISYSTATPVFTGFRRFHSKKFEDMCM